MINGQLQLVPTGCRPSGEIPSFPDLMKRIALLELLCNAIARSLS